MVSRRWRSMARCSQSLRSRVLILVDQSVWILNSAGISRSTAGAFIATCALDPDRDEAVLAADIRHMSPTATPNIRMVRFADELLGRNGRMVAAIEAIGRGRDAFEGIPFSLGIRRPQAR